MRYDNQKVTGVANKYYYWLFGGVPLLSVDGTTFTADLPASGVRYCKVKIEWKQMKTMRKDLLVGASETPNCKWL